MNLTEVKDVQIDGVYACVPDIRVDNREALRDLYPDSADAILKATGINSRYIASEGVTAVDLCCFAAERLLNDANAAGEEIGAILFVTFTPDYLMPFNASIVQERLNLPRSVAAFDMNLACSGYVYGLWNAALIARNTGKKVLLLDGDVQSAYVSTRDKATAPVLADAGSATLIAPASGAGRWTFSFYTDGSGRDALRVPVGGVRHRVTAADLAYTERDDGSFRRNTDIYMDGYRVFRFVAQDIAALARDFIRAVGSDADFFDAFVPHQANIYMIKQLARRIGVRKERLWLSGDEYGNSASATIPVTIAAKAREKLSDAVSEALVAGFGAGLSAAVGGVQLRKDAKYAVFQYEKQKTG